MRAWVLHAPGDLRMERVPDPVPGTGEALLEVLAAGVCGSDIPRIFRTGAHRHPLIPGHEFSGVAVDVGEGVGRGVIGRRFGVYPLIPCGECLPCRKGLMQMCRNYGYLGSRQDGGFAELVAVPVKNLIEVPKNVSASAAAMLEPLSVAVHASRRAVDGLKKEDDPEIAVCGLGTIGFLCALFLRSLGYEKLHLIGSKEYQRRRAYELGFKVSAPEKYEGGADVFIECVGSREAYELGVSCSLPGGRVMLVGNPRGDMWLQKDVYWKILRNELTILGTWNSNFGGAGDSSNDWTCALKLLSSGGFSPECLITHRIALEDLYSGLSMMRDKSGDYTKVMVEI